MRPLLLPPPSATLSFAIGLLLAVGGCLPFPWLTTRAPVIESVDPTIPEMPPGPAADNPRVAVVVHRSANGDPFAVTRFTYDESGHVSQVAQDDAGDILVWLLEWGDGLLRTVASGYSGYALSSSTLSWAEGRLVQVDGGGQDQTDFEYDGRGRLSTIIDPEKTERLAYDDEGRLVRYAGDEEFYTSQFELDWENGVLTTIRELSSGDRWECEVDEQGRLVRTSQFAGGDSSGGARVSTYQYHENGLLQTIVHTFVVDGEEEADGKTEIGYLAGEADGLYVLPWGLHPVLGLLDVRGQTTPSFDNTTVVPRLGIEGW